MKQAILCGLLIMSVVTAGCQGTGNGSSTRAARERNRPARVVAERTGKKKSRSGPAKPVPKKPPSSLTEQADKLYLAGEHKQAYEMYCKAIRHRSSDLDAHDGLSRCVGVLKRYDEGCQFYEKLVKKHPRNARLLYGTARMYLTVGDRQLAGSTAYRSLRYEKNLPRSYFLIALMQVTDSVPRYKSATRAFQQTLERDPEYGPAYYQLALLKAGVHRKRSEALELAVKAMKYLRPVEKNVRYETQILLGALYASEGRNDQALAVFRQALSEHGDRVYEKTDVGLLLARMGRPEAAKREWQTVINNFGLAHPTGLKAYRQKHADRSGSVNISAFLPRSATSADYRDLVSHIGQAGSVQAVSVPENLKAALDEYRTPVFYKSVDLNGDGKKESIVVDVRPKQDAFRQADGKGRNLPRVRKRWRLTSPTLHVFTSRGGVIGTYSSRMDHFHNVDVVDFDADGTAEIVLTEFGSGNLLNIVILAKRGVHYRPALVCPVTCADDSCGALIADLSGDGKRELMIVSDNPPWVDVYRFTADGTFAECHRDFPRFYRDYTARHGRLSDEALNAYPVVRARLKRARTALARGEKTTTVPVKVNVSQEPKP